MKHSATPRQIARRQLEALLDLFGVSLDDLDLFTQERALELFNVPGQTPGEFMAILEDESERWDLCSCGQDAVDDLVSSVRHRLKGEPRHMRIRKGA